MNEPTYLSRDLTGGTEKGTKGIPKDVVESLKNDPPTFMVAWEGERGPVGNTPNPFLAPNAPRGVPFASVGGW